MDLLFQELLMLETNAAVFPLKRRMAEITMQNSFALSYFMGPMKAYVFSFSRHGFLMAGSRYYFFSFPLLVFL